MKSRDKKQEGINIKEISEQTISRYSLRYKELGKNIRTLGWGSTEQQVYRFEQTLSAIKFDNKIVLDIGCGFADYFNFLGEKKIRLKKYIGFDINPEFIAECKNQGNKFAEYYKINIAEKSEMDSFAGSADIGVMLGLLNYNLGNSDKNYIYTESMLKNAFSLVKEVLIVDFLSIFLTDAYPREDFVFYHDLSVVLKIVSEITSNFVIKHDYLPIPQKEFMVYIYK